MGWRSVGSGPRLCTSSFQCYASALDTQLTPTLPWSQITANLPGAAVGAFAGSRLGAIRDAKGKAVYTVFKDLPQTDKARILAELAKQVFGMSGLSGLAGAATGSR